MNNTLDVVLLQQELKRERKARIAAEQLARQQAEELAVLKTARQGAVRLHSQKEKSFSPVPSLLLSLPYAVLATDAAGTIVFANKTFCQLFGLQFEPAELVGLPVHQLEQTPILAAIDAHYIRKTTPESSPFKEFVIPGGTIIEREYLPLAQDMTICGAAWVYRDITARRVVQDKLELNADLQEEYPNPIFRISFSGELHYLNLAGQQLLQHYSAKRAAGFMRLLLNKVLASDAHIKAESIEARVDGKYYLLFAVPIQEKGYINLYLTDITERRLAELALQESQNFVNNIARTIPNVIYIYDLDEDQTIYYNQHIKSILGYTESDLIAMNGHVLMTLVVEEDLPKLDQHGNFMKLSQDGQIVEVEYRVRCKDGSIKYLHCRETVFKRKEDGSVCQVIGSAEDVTTLRNYTHDLLTQKEFYEAILNHIPSDVAVYNKDLRYLFVNPAAVSDPHLREWIIGKNNEEYCTYRNVPPQRIESRGRHLQKVLEEKAQVEFEEKLINKSGEPIYHIRRLNPVLDENGEVNLVIGHGLNITELRKAQEEILLSEAKNRAILAAIPDLMFIIDKDGTYVDMKNVDQKDLLVPKDQVIGNKMNNMLPDHLCEYILGLVRKVLATGVTERTEYILELPTGNRNYEGRIIKYNDNEILAIIRDTTEELKVAKEVQEKNELIRMVLDSSPSIIYVRDKEGRFVLSNQELSKLLDKAQDEIIGKHLSELITNKDLVDTYLDTDHKVITEGRELKLQEHYTKPDGEEVWFSTVKRPLATADGRINVLAISTNITEQKLANLRLAQSEEMHRLLSENSKDVICLHDPSGKYIYISKGIEEMQGYTAEELLYTDPYHLIHPDDRKHVLENGHMLAADSKKSTFVQYRMQHKNGGYIWLETNIKPLLNKDSEVERIQTSTRNITQRRAAEEALKNSEKKYRDLINYSQAYICTHNMQGEILSVNPYLLNTLGYKEEEMLGKELSQFFPEAYQANFSVYLDLIKEKQVVDGIFRILKKNKEIRHLNFKNYKVQEPGAEPYIIGIAHDITDRVMAEHELKLAKEAAEESARVKENFLANMSHEIRTPMNGILGIAGLMRKTNLTETQLGYLNVIQQSADNLLVVINDILDVAKIEAGKLELETIPFNLTETIRGVFNNLSFRAEEKDLAYIKVPFNLPHTEVLGDPYRLNQILLNLLSNALKFTEEGSITLSCKVLNETEDDLTLEISVADTGIGIPEDKRELIFDGFTQAYSSTTRKYGGTGLGLSICKNLVEMQGGRIWVESTEGKGSIFKFILTYPKCKEHQKPATDEVAVDFASMNDVHVLLAEDNEVNIFLAQSILEGWNFKVDVARNGLEAVEMVERNNYDIILMDIQMPVLSGLDATKVIRSYPDKAKSGVPIIALTANALKGDSDKYLGAGMNDYISKPFNEERLYLKIQKLLPHKVKERQEMRLQKVTATEVKKEASAPLYDLTLLEKMSRGNVAFILRTKQVFVDTVPVTLAEMQQSAQAGNWAAVSAAAHKLKSTIDTIRIDRLKEVVRSIESGSKKGEITPKLHENIAYLVQVMLEVINQFRSEMNN